MEIIKLRLHILGDWLSEHRDYVTKNRLASQMKLSVMGSLSPEPSISQVAYITAGRWLKRAWGYRMVLRHTCREDTGSGDAGFLAGNP